MADTAKDAGQSPQQPVQSLFDEHRDGVKKRVSTAHSQEHQETVCNLVHSSVLIVHSLATYKVPKAHGAECHKAEIEGLQESPALHCCIEGGSPTEPAGQQ